MALTNLADWNNNKTASSPCGSACGSNDKPADKPSACGSADKPADKPTACGSACGAKDK